MEISNLAQGLRSADPRERVRTLRVLAMVEETRALKAVRWLYEHDPEDGVREVAGWAMRLLAEAHKRGHSTERAMEELYDSKLSADLKVRILASYHEEPVARRGKAARPMALEAAYRQRLETALDEDADVGSRREKRQPPALVAGNGGSAEKPVVAASSSVEDGTPELDDFSDLLEAGLTHLNVDGDDDE